MQVLAKISDVLAKISDIISAAMTFTVAMVILAQVTARYVFNAGFSWGDAFARYVIIWMVMLTAGTLVKEDGLITVDFFDSMWPESMKKVREVIYQVIFLVLLVVLIKTGWNLTANNWTNRITGTVIPWSYAYISIPAGSVAMLYQYIYKIAVNLNHRRREEASQ